MEVVWPAKVVPCVLTVEVKDVISDALDVIAVAFVVILELAVAIDVVWPLKVEP